MHLGGMRWDDSSPLFYKGLDVHLFRGGFDSQDLSSQLILDFEPDPADGSAQSQSIKASELALAANAALRALVVGGAVVFDTNFTVLPLHGFTIQSTTGVVSTPMSSPTPQVNNFRLRASATPVSASAPLTAFLRFHLHDGFAPNGVVLSPPSLTIRANGEKQQFGILAQFSDGVVGDVTNDPKTTWELFTKDSSGTLTPVPGNATATVTLDMNTGEVQASGPSTDTLVVQGSLELNLPALSVKIQGGLSVSGAWTDAFEVRFVDGAGIDQFSQVTNVLVLSDGFLVSEQPIFDELVDRLVQEIRFSTTCAPFSDFLRHKSINTFAGFLPSTESGCSVDYELAPVNSADLGQAVPRAVDPGTNPPTDLGHFIFGVGLPVLADATAATGDIVGRWNQLFPAFMGTATSTTILEQVGPWKALGTRSLAVNRDTALGITVGLRPNETSGHAKPNIGLSDLRTKLDDLQNLVSAAVVTEAGVSTSVGAVWAQSAKDRNFIMVLAAGAPSRGLNRSAADKTDQFRRTAAVGLSFLVDPVPFKAFSSDSRILALDPDPTSPDPHEVAVGTFLHEIAHSLECGDEYGVSSKIDPQNLSRTQQFGNLTLESTIFDAGTQVIDLSKTMWGALPRIRAAGVLSASPSAVGGGTLNFRLTLQPGQRDQFTTAGLKPGDPLYLRVRPLMAGLSAIQKQPNSPPDFSRLQSPQLVFVENDATNPDVLVVAAAKGAFPTVPWIVPGPVPPFLPIVLAPTIGSTNQELRLICPPMQAALQSPPFTSNNRALGVACTPPTADGEVSARVPPVDVPPEIVAANIRDLSRVVGLYDGGGGQACKVYHPTGYCRMRNATELEVTEEELFDAKYRLGGLTSYCHVCAYLMVDYVDPTLHAVIDARYASFYVEK